MAASPGCSCVPGLSRLMVAFFLQTVPAGPWCRGLPSATAGLAPRVDSDREPALFSGPSLQRRPELCFPQHAEVAQRRGREW